MQHEVVVHKARIPLAKGESLQMYTQRLNEAVRKYAITKLNIQKGGAYMIEAFDDSLIMDVYKRPLTDDGTSEYKYYSVEYSRTEKGDFTFSSFQEVERVTSFKPKAPLAITKTKTPSLVEPATEFKPGWVYKSIWGKLL
jgi:hypothetical protein